MGLELNFRLVCDECGAIEWLGWFPAGQPCPEHRGWSAIGDKMICPDHIVTIGPRSEAKRV